jgi:uncharacterized protein YijF (DUF1287 family)
MLSFNSSTRKVMGSLCGVLLLLLAMAAPVAWSQGERRDPAETVLDAARAQIGRTVGYDGSYRKLAYPGGDVLQDRGVCTDVLIRAFRAAGVDLQVLVHEDMTRAFGAYPKAWGLSRPDPNIDHRRVPNLKVYFERHGKSLPISTLAADYLPGDMVAWRLPSGVPHIGLVSSSRDPTGARPLVIHNIGQGTREEDILFIYQITGHYRYFQRRP